MKWFFHIGPNKTGTTTIQFALHKAYKSLVKRGVLYPKNGIVNTAHHMLNFSLSVELNGRAPYAEALGVKNIPSFDRLIGDIRREARKNVVDRIIVSSEILWTWNSEKIQRLERSLDGDEAVIVVAVRPHLERELSMWQEGVKHGFLGSSLSYLDSFGDTARSNRGLVLTERIAKWKYRGFGVLLTPFPSGAAKLPIWDSFLNDVAGATIDQISAPDTLNISLDYLALKTIQNALALAVESRILETRLSKNNKVQPLDAVFTIRKLVLEIVTGIDRAALPAYTDFLLDANSKNRASEYADRYLEDLSELFETFTATPDVCRMINNFDPLSIFKSIRDDLRSEYFRQNNLAMDYAQQVMHHFES